MAFVYLIFASNEAFIGAFFGLKKKITATPSTRIHIILLSFDHQAT